MNLGAISELFDSYGRTARLYPGVVCLLPLLWHLPMLSGSVDLSLPEGVAAAAVGSALLYLIASFARYKGKALEPDLIAQWGGWPTSILLRHRDDRLDALTKARYHSQLSRLVGLSMPSAADEQVDPERADATYRSATKWLIEARRGDAYSLLHKENAAYGFRRNLYGLRNLALMLGGLLLLLAVAVMAEKTSGPFDPQSILNAVKAERGWATAAVLDLAYLAFFWFVVTPRYVFQSGTDYATALLRTLDMSEVAKASNTQQP